MSINYKELSKGQVVNHLRTRFIDDGVAIVDNFLEKDVYKKINNLWTHRKYFKAQKQSDKLAYGNEFRHYFTKTLSSGTEVNMRDLSWPDKDEVYKCNFSESSVIPKIKDVTVMIHKLIKPIAESILGEPVNVGKCHANIYKKNGDNFARAHSDGSSFHSLMGFILYMGKTDWKYDWGGLLHNLHPTTNKVGTILPVSNRLVFINHGLNLRHWITPVCKWAKEDRKTLVGMFEKLNQWEYWDEDGNSVDKYGNKI